MGVGFAVRIMRRVNVLEDICLCAVLVQVKLVAYIRGIRQQRDPGVVGPDLKLTGKVRNEG